MKYYLMDTNFNIIEGIELYSSMIWTDRYFEPGDFELYTVATPENMKLFKNAANEHYYIVRTDDDLSSMRCMIVNNIDLDLKKDSDDYIIVTGKDLKYLLHRRVVIKDSVLAGDVESELRRLVTENAISPEDRQRIIPMLELSDPIGFKEVINADVRGENLDDIISNICKLNKLGWDIRLNLNTKRLIFSLYQGTDRSYSQDTSNLDKVNSYVVFSEDYDNLLKTDYKFNTDNYKNAAYVTAEYIEYDAKADKYEYIDFTQVVHPSKMDKAASGLNRFELYVDGSDVNSEYSQVPNAYRFMLMAKGREELKDYTEDPSMTGEVVPNYNFKLGEDYFLGDLVTVINTYGIKFDARVSEIISTENTSKNQCIPKFIVENWEGKNEDEDDKLKPNEIREIEENPSNTRISENGSVRRLSLGYEYTDRACTIKVGGMLVDDVRVTESGVPIIAVKSDYIKEE